MKNSSAEKILLHRPHIKTPMMKTLINQSRNYGMGIQFVCSDFSDRDDYLTAPIRSFDFFVMCHIFSGSGKLYLVDEGTEIFCPQGTAIIICPGVRHICGYTSKNTYGEDYIKFCGMEIDYLTNCDAIKTGTYYIGTNRVLQKMAEIFNPRSAESHFQIQIELQKLLLHIHTLNAQKHENQYLQNLLYEISQSPERWWSIEDMTSFCKCSLQRLRKYFLNETGMLPKAYTEYIKLKSAAELLQNSNESIEYISKSLGYRDRFHFSRRFKIYSGHSPGEYRNKINASFCQEE